MMCLSSLPYAMNETDGIIHIFKHILIMIYIFYCNFLSDEQIDTAEAELYRLIFWRFTTRIMMEFHGNKSILVLFYLI